MAKKPRKLVVNVVLDTNSLFTEAAHNLVNLETADLMKESNTAEGIETVWYMPSTVRGERKYQMLNRAEKILPQIEKVERLLGHKLGISKEILAERVEATISAQLHSMNMQELVLDHAKVDWPALADKAVNRIPPFESGEKEKGFRDALILESFYQLVEEQPKSPGICRTFLITGDELLKLAAETRIEDRGNVRILGTLEEFRTIINALKSEISEQLLNSILPMARLLFWNDKDEGCLWRRGVQSEIFQKNYALLTAKVGSDGAVTGRTVGVPITTFIKKVGQRISFETKIPVEIEITTKTYAAAPSGFSTPTSGLSGASIEALKNLGLAGFSEATNPLTQGILGQPQFNVVERKNTDSHMFAAKWHATLTTTGKLINAQLDNVEHVVAE